MKDQTVIQPFHMIQMVDGGKIFIEHQLIKAEWMIESENHHLASSVEKMSLSNTHHWS